MPTISSHIHTPTDTPYSTDLLIRTLLHADYEATHANMLEATLKRVSEKKSGNSTPDELWLVEHNNVYTLGQAGKEEHILQRGNTPIIKTDRGGQVTWHGQGQLVVYCLIDLNKRGWSVRDLVSHTEQSLEDVLNATLNNTKFYARARKDAPGVYIYSSSDKTGNDAIMLGKIASLGFKIKHGFSYHGLALNLTCDLGVFNAINPCGYAGMQMLKLADFVDLPTVSNNHLDSTNTNTLVNLDITQKLVHNLKQRQAGQIMLRKD